jgi:isoleucyl-tRNA synthetase
MAPILSFTAEEIWAHLPAGERPASPLLAGLPGDGFRDEQLATKWERLLSVRTAVTKALEEARQSGLIGHSLDARVHLGAADGLRDLLEQQEGTLPAFLIVSQVQLSRDLGAEALSPLMPELKVRIERARGAKCERCWNYSEAVGSDAEHPGVCARCLPVIRAQRP